MTEFSITCTKDNLVTGLLRVASVAGRNSQLPILHHILLQNKKGVLHLTSTDLEVGVHTVVGGKTKGDGAVTIPARSFLAYIQQLPSDQPITVQAKGQSIHVSTIGFSAQFPTANPDDFPLLPQGKKDTVISLAGDVFTSALQQVIFAAARDETRPEIRGVYISVGNGVVRLAATDSFRLAEEVIPYSGESSGSFILPLSSAQEIVRLFSDSSEIMVAPQDSHVLLFSDETDLSSRLIDGSYPDYQQIIPTTSKTTITVSREDFLRALKTLTVFLPRDSRRVELEVQPNKKKLIARVVGGGVGEGVVDIPITGKGDQLKVLVNIQYFLEGLQHITTKDCLVGFNTEASPIVIQPSATEGDYVYVVMPIRL